MIPRVVPLYSANNHFQHAEVLRRNRQRRTQYREFFLEGVRPITMALEHGWTINAFLYSPEHGLSDWAKNVLARSQARTHFELPARLLAQLSNKTDTSELIAVAAMPEDRLSRVPIHESMLAVVFDRPGNPGNLGTLIRSCDALHADGLIITGHGVDLYDPETISASTGSLFALPVVRLSGPRELLPWFEAIRRTIGSLAIVGSDESAAVDVWDHGFTRPMVLLVGNEKWGLSAAYKEMCDTLVRIPIGGSATSLNVACAASILLYEADRQTRSGGDPGACYP